MKKGGVHVKVRVSEKGQRHHKKHPKEEPQEESILKSRRFQMMMSALFLVIVVMILFGYLAGQNRKTQNMQQNPISTDKGQLHIIQPSCDGSIAPNGPNEEADNLEKKADVFASKAQFNEAIPIYSQVIGLRNFDLRVNQTSRSFEKYCRCLKETGQLKRNLCILKNPSTNVSIIRDMSR